MVSPFTLHRGTAAVLMADNIDTDQIIPSREMKSVSRTGLAEGLFAGWRYETDGSRTPRTDFALNRPDAAGATVLVSGENFGCGSSREHAVWALAQYGFRALIAKSFGSIFRGNCVRNGILPIVLQTDSVPAWNAATTVTIDLPAQTVTRDDAREWTGHFDIDAYSKKLLLEGLDPIELTLSQSEAIERFFARDAAQRPWLYAGA